MQYICSKPKKPMKTGIGPLDTFLKLNIESDSETCRRSGRYKLVFHTLPSKGAFEVMMEYNVGREAEGRKSKLSLVGDISRLDRYGYQSHCIKDNALLAQYCYCKDLE